MNAAITPHICPGSSMVGQAPEMERGIAFSRLWIVWRKKSERKKQTMKIIHDLEPGHKLILMTLYNARADAD